MLHAYPSSSSSSFTSAKMIYDARKAKIEGDRRRLRQSRRGRLLVSTATGEDDDENDFEEDDDVMNEDEIEVNLDAALANLARERRGQMLFQTFIEENERNEEDASEYDLFHGACLIAMHCNPELDVSEQKNRVKELAKEVEKEFPENRDERFPLRTIKKISTLLFNKEANPETAFRGNLEDYYAVENSCVDKVLETRTGIPITLSLIYMEIAKMIGINMVGVNLPGHFMIRPSDVPECEILIDCFHDGDVLFVEDAEEMLSKLYKLDTEKGERVTIDRSFLEDKHLKPKTFYTRMLTNLKSIYFNRSDYKNALAMCEYQKCCAPDPSIRIMNIRDAGMCHYLLGNYSDSMLDLTEYLESEYSRNASPEDRARVQSLRDQARAHLANF
jgi:regulator of sirC expression with transglutaminase-like and TPR domain